MRGIEPQAVLLDDHPAIVEHEPQLGERGLDVRDEAPRPVERGPHLAHARPALEELGRGPGRDQLAEAQAPRVVAQEPEPAELRAPLGGQPQEPRQLAQREHPLGRRTSA